MKIEGGDYDKACCSSLREFGIQDLAFMVLHCGVLCNSCRIMDVWVCGVCLLCLSNNMGLKWKFWKLLS
jgi:hypothetical protein